MVARHAPKMIETDCNKSWPHDGVDRVGVAIPSRCVSRVLLRPFRWRLDWRIFGVAKSDAVMHEARDEDWNRNTFGLLAS